MAGSRPYYQDDAVTIYHGDSREILPGLEPVDMVLTDPPYGTEDLGGGYGRRQLHNPDGRTGRTIAGDKDLEMMKSVFGLLKLTEEAYVCTFLAAQKIFEVGQICFEIGLRYVGECIWDKGAPGLGYTLRYSHESCLVFRMGERVKPIQAALSVVRHSVNHVDTQSRHPHEKPVVFWTNVMQLRDGLVLDPFMGSGATLRAAKNLGRRAIGIELDEKYCEMAAQRMGQEVLAL